MKRANIRTRKPDTVREWNRTGQNKRNDILNTKAQAAGWDGISNFLTAVIRDEAEIPKKISVDVCPYCVNGIINTGVSGFTLTCKHCGGTGRRARPADVV